MLKNSNSNSHFTYAATLAVTSTDAFIRFAAFAGDQ